MGTAYGDGLSRALRRFAPAGRAARPAAGLVDARRDAAGARDGAAAARGVVPHRAAVRAGCRRATAGPGVAAASYLSLNVVWVVTWLPLTWLFRVVAPGRPAWRAAFGGAVVTGAFVSGFLQGFLLFLALPVDLGRPFGGLYVVGVVSGPAALAVGAAPRGVRRLRVHLGPGPRTARADRAD